MHSAVYRPNIPFWYKILFEKCPLPKPDAYRRSLIKKYESLVRSIRWKAHFFINGKNDAPKNNTFDLKSRNSPPQINELKNLEDYLLLDSLRTTKQKSLRLLKTFCEMEGFAKGSPHQNWQRIGKRPWYLRCSVSLSFVDDEVYHVMYRYMTWRHITSLQMTSALSDIQILSCIRAWSCVKCLYMC